MVVKWARVTISLTYLIQPSNFFFKPRCFRWPSFWLQFSLQLRVSFHFDVVVCDVEGMLKRLYDLVFPRNCLSLTHTVLILRPYLRWNYSRLGYINLWHFTCSGVALQRCILWHCSTVRLQNIYSATLLAVAQLFYFDKFSFWKWLKGIQCITYLSVSWNHFFFAYVFLYKWGYFCCSWTS